MFLNVYTNTISSLTIFTNTVVADIQARVVSNANDYLKDIQLWTHNNRTRHSVKHLAVAERLSYPHNCLRLDISEELSKTGKQIEGLQFLFHQTDEFSVNIFLEDRLATLSRDNINAMKPYSGPVIDINNMSDVKYYKYSADIAQRIFTEEDLSIECRNYPWSGFSSYNDCDEGFLEDWITENYGGNIRPFFMAKDQRNATAGPVYLSGNCSDDHNYTDFNGYATSGCPLPCIQTLVLPRGWTSNILLR